MSLNVYLKSEEPIKCTCDYCGSEYEIQEVLYSANITHNLTMMADMAGIYYACWRPEEIGAKKAKDIIGLLESGLKRMKADPVYFKQFDSDNGWGIYDHFVPFIERYLNACREHPDAIIEVSR